jgi:hypothetical protein
MNIYTFCEGVKVEALEIDWFPFSWPYHALEASFKVEKF